MHFARQYVRGDASKVFGTGALLQRDLDPLGQKCEGILLNVAKHLGDCIKQDKHEKGQMREDEMDKFYLFEEEGNQHLDGDVDPMAMTLCAVRLWM